MPFTLYSNVMAMNEPAHVSEATVNPAERDAKVSGALFDLLGYMTTRPTVLRVGGNSEVSAVVSMLREWADVRGFDISGADVLGWQSLP